MFEFLAAAECLESLSDIQMNYGSDEQKMESLQTLMRAFKYYKKGLDSKRAIIAAKKALTIFELSSHRDVKTIGKKYEECGQLYEALDLHYLAKLNHKIADYFDDMTFLRISTKVKF